MLFFRNSVLAIEKNGHKRILLGTSDLFLTLQNKVTGEEGKKSVQGMTDKGFTNYFHDA